MKNLLMWEVKKLNEKYEELKEETNIMKADGSLSKLYNLKTAFDETFDQFFDNVELRKKYNDWDYENNSIIFEKSNVDLLNELDEKDLKEYIEFYKNYIEELEDKLNEIQNQNIINLEF